MTPGYIQLKVIVNKTLLVREMGKHLPSEQRAEQLHTALHGSSCQRLGREKARAGS